MTTPNQEGKKRWTIRVCRRCGEVAGDKTSFGPWCEGGHRGHDAETIELVPKYQVDRLEGELAEARRELCKESPQDFNNGPNSPELLKAEEERELELTELREALGEVERDRAAILDAWCDHEDRRK